MHKPRIIFRADGSTSIGLGHISRCIALADMLMSQFTCEFIMNQPGERVAALVTPMYKLHVISCRDTTEEITALEGLLTTSDIFVADGYDFDEKYQLGIRGMAKKLVMIDDMADGRFHADVIFNHGDISILPPYDVPPLAKVYSGLPYLILRKEFLHAASRPKQLTPNMDTAFICMGGSDPFRISIKVLNSLKECDFISRVIIVTGSVYNDVAELSSVIGSFKGKNIQHVQNASAEDMAELIGMADVAICTASSIALETCCVKTALICGTIADNQNAIYSALAKAGCCYPIGDWKTVPEASITEALNRFKDLNTVKEISFNQGRHFDGRSGERILPIFTSLVA